MSRSRTAEATHKPHLIVVGSSNTDLVIQCDRLPKPGETLLGGAFARFAGGKGANQAVAAARAGARVTFIGAHGNDDFGRAAKAGLRAEGIDVRFFCQRAGVPSGVALILVGGRDRQNLIAVSRSANDTLSAADVRAARSAFRQADAVVAQLEIPLAAVQASAELAAEAGIPFILNPAPAQKLPAKLLRLVETLTPNEHEVRVVGKGARRTVVTLGARGVLIGKLRVPAPKVKPVDTVGAGDCFTAWLAVGIAEGLSLEDAARRAVRAASIAVTRSGAQPGMPYRREVRHHDNH
ncbi:MAG: ribokinase [Verrucomicrobiota bacterium]